MAKSLKLSQELAQVEYLVRSYSLTIETESSQLEALERERVRIDEQAGKIKAFVESAKRLLPDAQKRLGQLRMQAATASAEHRFGSANNYRSPMQERETKIEKIRNAQAELLRIQKELQDAGVDVNALLRGESGV